MENRPFSPLIVQSLPGRGLDGILYLVDKYNGTYDEYLWIDNVWVYYGVTEIDLSVYYTKEETDAKLAALGFTGTPEEWSALTPQEQEAYLVAKVGGENSGN